MTLARWQANIVDNKGNIQSDALITVRSEITGAPLASLFSDRDGSVSISNPFNADGEGFAAFHVAGGAYQITASKGSFSKTWRYVAVGLAQESDELTFGIPWKFDDAVADADPGAEFLRFNNATLASVTEIYLSETAVTYGDVTNWLITFDDGGSSSFRGTILVQAGSAFLLATVTGSVVDGTDYRKVLVTPVVTGGTFADGVQVSVAFFRAGIDGDGDVTGPAGGVVDNEFALFSSTTGKAIKGSSLLVANNAAVYAATANRVFLASLLSSAAAVVALSFASPIAWSWTDGINRGPVTMTANGTLGNPTAEIPGQTRTILIQGNDGTARTLSFGSEFGGDLPTLDDITSTKKYLLTIYCKSAGQFLVTAIDGSDA